ncbi:hypothetical protein Aph01nite_31480 [Acrocarpospora phusangensis]|uniref:Nucleoside phosphorylase domain-containing protein n=1 Tax=Acrocarpospora phusangensis TaxID=1070424 RepID=A0A919QCE2_9ACTN|nr:5'-methylthioadenosine/S-adenosylhomocysteine nucleosidase [Acrocarpospora phusangensis]GIH24838.1 hypothetical protein Aph01nite_31480 [Acrocarpospora phusangensis]
MLSFTAAREAARQVRRAERGRDAIRTVRPRGVGVFRARAPLAVVLYAASREGRLVWQGPDRFALLEPPQDDMRGHRPRGWLRAIDRQWEFVLFFGPPAVAMLLGLIVGLAGLYVSSGVLLLAAMVLLLAAMLYVTAVMTLGLGVLLLGGLRWLAARPVSEGDSMKAGVRFVHWTMPLCHCPDDARAPALLATVAERVRRLMENKIDRSAESLGGVAARVQIVEPLVCVLSGATTAGAEAAIMAMSTSASSGVSDHHAGITFLTAGASARLRRPKLAESGGALLLYTVGVAMIVVVEALGTYPEELEACRPRGDCAGRPATFGTALLWFGYRLAFQNPPGIFPATAQSWAFGWANGLLGLMFVLVAGVTMWRAGAARKERRTDFEKDIDAVLSTSTVLLLVVTPVERDAVIRAARELTGTEPIRRHLDHHTALDLGVVRGARVLLARSRPGVLEPGAATLTAQSLIDQLNPDYLLLTGTCSGLREDRHRLGDVLICTQLRAMDHKKVIDYQWGQAAEIPRGDRVSPSVTLLNRCESARLEPGVPGVHSGLILSGNTHLDSAALRDRMAAAEPDAIGVEMEGAGVYAAAAKGKVDWIVVKAISDWGTGRTEENHALAARNAAEFVADVLAGGGLDRPPLRA